MCSRIFSTLPLAFALVACGDGAVVPEPAPDPVTQDNAELVDCAIGPGSEFGTKCAVERVLVEDQQVVVVHHPGGGFRRFALAGDGTGLTAYDGADAAVRTLDGDTLQVQVGQDRYRFPARRLQGHAGS